MRQIGTVRSAFAFHKIGKGAFGFVFLFIVVGGLREFSGRGGHGTPAGFEYQATGGAEGHVGCLTLHGGGGKTAVGIEHGDKTTDYEVVNIALHVGKVMSSYAGGNDSVVVGHLRRIEHLFALQEFGTAQGHEQFAVLTADAVEYGTALGVNVVRQEGGVDTRISSHLFS